RDVARLVAEPDRGPGRVGVPDGIRQRLLDDAVRGQVHPGRQRDRGALDLEVDPQAGAADLVEHIPEFPEGSRGRGLQPGGRAVSPMTSTDRRAWSGRPGSSELAASAWTAIRLTWWATTSCSSRAIRIRSRSAASEDWRSSSASARSARLCAAWTLARLARLSRPAATA